MSKKPIRVIEQELETFSPDDQERLGEDFVAYLRRLRAVRRELDKAERDVGAGRIADLTDLDAAIGELRRKYAGA